MGDIFDWPSVPNEKETITKQKKNSQESNKNLKELLGCPSNQVRSGLNMTRKTTFCPNLRSVKEVLPLKYMWDIYIYIYYKLADYFNKYLKLKFNLWPALASKSGIFSILLLNALAHPEAYYR